jgi:hypothetical protein
MAYKLFLDDIRDFGWVYPNENPDEWIVCRSYDQAVAIVMEQGWPSAVSFDHDLGDGSPSGYDFAKWLVDLDLTSGDMPDGFVFQIHSANPVGRENIQGLMGSYISFRISEHENLVDLASG